MRIVASLLLAVLVLCTTPALAQFHPSDLSPTLYIEAVDTFVNPADNADCSSDETPYICCTDSGAGTCDQAVTTFTVASCTTRAADCTDSGAPDACCTEAGVGATCCWELSDTANGGLGPKYCRDTIFPDGCIARWQGIAWEGADWYKSASPDTPLPPIGRDFQQDDHELMGYIADCFANGLPCVRGRPPWVEPDGAGGANSSQPSQDGTLEIEIGERTWSDCTTSEESWVAVLARPVLQVGNCDPGSANGRVGILGIGSSLVFGYDAGDGEFYLGNSAVSGTGDLVADKWQLFELVRNSSDEVAFYIDGVDESLVTPPTDTAAWFPGTQLIGCAGGKNCDWNDSCGQQGHEFQGDYAMVLALCSAPTAQNRSDLLQYAQDTWAYQNEPVRRGGSQGAAIQAN